MPLKGGGVEGLEVEGGEGVPGGVEKGADRRDVGDVLPAEDLAGHLLGGEEPVDRDGAVAHVAVVDVDEEGARDVKAAAGKDVVLDGDVVEV